MIVCSFSGSLSSGVQTAIDLSVSSPSVMVILYPRDSELDTAFLADLIKVASTRVKTRSKRAGRKQEIHFPLLTVQVLRQVWVSLDGLMSVI